MNRSDISFKVLLNLDTNSSLRLRYAALLHQISALKRELSVYFPNYNENQIKKILKDMKFSNKQIEEISHILLIHNIPLPYKSLALNEETRDYYMRRFQYKVRPEYIKDYVNFFKAKERVISSKIILTPELENDILERAKIVQTIELKDLIINGDDIIKFLDIDKRIASQRELIGLCLRVIRERVEADPNSNTKVEIEKILIGINKIIYQCRAKVVKRVHIISTDHIRRLYSDNSPKYALWENEHTYKFANWLALCLLRKRRKNVIIFDGTNFNLPSHPRHREKLNRKFNDYNPIYIHTEATEEEIKSNYEIRVKEIATIQKSDADLNVYFRYKQKIESYPNFLKTPANRELIKISTRSPEFKDEINKIAIKIHRSNHRFIIISGNVLSGKTYLSNALEAELERLN